MDDPRTLGAVLHRQAVARGEAAFLVCDDERLTYADALAHSTRLAKALLAAGAGRGSHLAMLMPNGKGFAVAALAAARLGAVLVPLSTMSMAGELRDLLDRSDAEYLLAFAGYRAVSFVDRIGEAVGLDPYSPPPLLAPSAPTLRRVFFAGEHAFGLPQGLDPGWTLAGPLRDGADDALLEAAEADVAPSDDLVIVHTSGSTSAPKGVVHTHGALLDHLRTLNRMRSYGPGEILFSNSPFFWIGGFAYTLLGTLLAGATLVCSRAADPPRVLDVIERERPTMVNGYASSIAPLAADPGFPGRDLSSIRRGNLYPIMPEAVRPADPGLRPGLLGMTEGGSVVLAADHEDELPEEKRGSFGGPVPGLAARCVARDGGDAAPGEPGELWLRGPALMRGYHGRERHTTFDADGWLRTGDLVRVDADGHWYFLGRDDDVIKTSGANVSPAEVQDAILTATGLPSYVLGLPDPERGQIVAAVLVTPGAAPPLRAALAPILSAYKIPRAVRAVPASAVPLRSSGKADLSALRRLFDDD
ncbi:acyl-CoA synthetase (AMP-forming)/AMP-acid ligase II [Actinocorallia herbida]|uniref:Acyl-CoA synthetase (AMP-forming)/AMP-acid ligase II n=1 Tax=Actinocorallia herbida TaxID=58109 RepID=A0A3N1CWS7_9ACTN|nr:fatty acid--CoA ligase family protein [Actinocorallia herbida]ROO85168.1 acyl-CoA synthetase (AMP-forming)/AMP-acid ligase II [Actinocorallia herbida]